MSGQETGNLRRQWTRAGLSRYIEDQFLDGTLPIGSPLPSERSLSDQFGVSRPFVREVLSGLQHRGRVDIRPGRGASVREVGVADVARTMGESGPIRAATPRTLVEARISLERQTTALAATRASSSEISAIERSLETFEASEHLVDRARADIAFHLLIARASGNPVLETMFCSIAPMIFALMLRSLSDPDVLRQGAPYHRDIVQALRQRDPEAAASAASAHICLAEGTFGEDFDRRLDLVARRVIGCYFGGDTSLDDVFSACFVPRDGSYDLDVTHED